MGNKEIKEEDREKIKNAKKEKLNENIINWKNKNKE